MTIDDLKLVAPAIGQLTGAGIVSRGHDLDFKMRAIVHTSGAVMAACGDRPQQRLPEDIPQALGDLTADLGPGPGLVAFHGRLGPADEEDEECRADVAEGVGDDRQGRADPLDEPPGHAWAGQLRHGPAPLELRVAFHELIPVHQGGEVRLVGHVEEDREHAVDEGHHIELEQGQVPDLVHDRDRAERQGAPDVADDQDGSSPQPVDPGPRRQAEEDER